MGGGVGGRDGRLSMNSGRWKLNGNIDRCDPRFPRRGGEESSRFCR